MSMLNDMAREEARSSRRAGRASRKAETAALDMSTSEKCPNCQGPTEVLAGPSLPMHVCLSCRVALPAKKAV